MKHTKLLGFTAILLSAATANATTPLSVAGLAGTGVTADVSFGYTGDATSGVITISITNTTLDSGDTAGSFISAFAFNVPTISGVTFSTIGTTQDGGAVVALGTPNDTGWFAKYATDSIDGPMVGMFDFGVMDNEKAKFINDGGGGPTTPKIFYNETTTFTLAVTGSGLSGLGDSTFLDELSTIAPAGAFNFAVRFQGLPESNQGGSDLAVTVVPVPAAGLLCALGLFGVGVTRRTKKKLL